MPKLPELKPRRKTQPRPHPRVNPIPDAQLPCTHCVNNSIIFAGVKAKHADTVALTIAKKALKKSLPYSPEHAINPSPTYIGKSHVENHFTPRKQAVHSLLLATKKHPSTTLFLLVSLLKEGNNSKEQ